MELMSHHIYAVRLFYNFQKKNYVKIFVVLLFFVRRGDKENFWLGIDMAGNVGGERTFSIECLLCGYCHLVLSPAHIKPG